MKYSVQKFIGHKLKNIPNTGSSHMLFDKDHSGKLSIVTDDGRVHVLGNYDITERSGRDDDGIYTTISGYDSNRVLRFRSTLLKSNPALANYDIRKEEFFRTDASKITDAYYSLVYDTFNVLIKEEYAKTISNSQILLEIPVAGESPVIIINNEQYQAAVYWTPDDNPFQSGISYTANISISPHVGYTIYGIPANFFTVTDALSVVNLENSGEVSVTFPATI